MSEHIDYFKSKQHEELCKRYIDETRIRLGRAVEEDGPLASVSYLIAILSAAPSFMKTLGMRKVAVALLKDALAEARKGSDE